MGFLSIFKSQMPIIIKRLEAVHADLVTSKRNIEQLILLEKTLISKEVTIDKTEEMVKSAVDGFGVAMWVKDLEGRFLYVNKACCKQILKCTREEALNLTNGDLKRDALAQVCMQSDKKVLESKTTRRWIESAIYADGTHVWIDTVKSPVFSAGKLIGVTGNAVDITDDIPLIIKELHKDASSIEIPLNATLSGKQFIKLLERREAPR